LFQFKKALYNLLDLTDFLKPVRPALKILFNQNKREHFKNISQFEFIKPTKDLFLRYGKEKYRQDRF
jgi:hypothetical protein